VWGAPIVGRGFYIAVEGIDGAGTTTHARLLAQRLSDLGYCARFIEEPSKGPIGGLIRHLLQHGPFHQHVMTLLFAADRLLQYETTMKPLLNRGCIIVSDRSWISSLAYQSCDCFPYNVPYDWIYEVNKYFPRPHILVYIDIDPLLAFKRLIARGRAIEQPERLTVLYELRRSYHKVLEKLKRVLPIVIHVQASPSGIERSVDSVSREITCKTLAALKYLEAVEG
jgi:dTMP kinase